jgi:hypothetical protein
MQMQRLSKVNIIDIQDLSPDVKRQKRERPWNYYCFGLAPEVLAYVAMTTHQQVTYLDADTYWFGDPKLAFDEMGDKELAIVSHNFPPHDFERLSPNGLFNVSLVSVKNTPDARMVLTAWRDGVRNKCDKESCGDQKYLDQFPSLLGNKLHIFDGKRIGAGPWNVYTYTMKPGPQVLCGIDYGSNYHPMLYYHFHELKVDGLNTYLTGYPLTNENKEFIYVPYLRVYEYVQNHIDAKEKEGFFRYA